MGSFPGSAVMMEVMRILKTLNLKLDRTVRIGDPNTMHLTEAHAKLSGYFNLDNGSGKIRGVYLQGNDAMRPLFETYDHVVPEDLTQASAVIATVVYEAANRAEMLPWRAPPEPE